MEVNFLLCLLFCLDSSVR